MIDSLKDSGFGVGPVCRVLGWSESAYYARKKRPKSARRLRDEQLTPLIEQVHAESGGTYGARRITHALRRKGVEVARCTVERLMRELGLEGVIRGQRRRTTVPEPSAPRPPDLVDRDFTASRPDQLWVADMTYVRTWSGWVYVAFVLDVYSRMIVGWQVANHMRTELPLDALEMALWRRRIKKDSGLIHHSDRGSQYVSIRYTDRLAEIGAAASVGSVADSYDNAMAEALNGTFKAELIEMQGPWKDVDQVERAIFQWVTSYNEETPPFRTRLRATGRARASLLAETEANPAVRLKQDHRTLRNSGQLTVGGLVWLGLSGYFTDDIDRAGGHIPVLALAAYVLLGTGLAGADTGRHN
ncbi:integrase [Streptomyces azureus]|uniref:Integrase n=1 Tax=Streptomyces azureus TaxID=146537 RepID=A0A0K8PID8_STRAJ|nr:integrase [Streptomyces azureus]